MSIAVELMDPCDGDEFEHMFKNENSLVPIGSAIDDEAKNSKWSKVFHTIS